MMRKLRHAKRTGEFNKGADDYETPRNALEMILRDVPHHNLIWDPFFCTGHVLQFFDALGYRCINVNRDFFKYEPFLYDIIVTNPPYSIKDAVLTRLLQLGRPFAALMPLSTIATAYFFTLMRNRTYQLVIANRRFNFLRHNNEPKTKNKVCTFATVWVTVGFEAFLKTTQQIVHRETHTY